MRLVYVTASFPYGVGEAYFESELAELERLGWDVLVIPRSTRGMSSSLGAPRHWQVRSGWVLSPQIVARALQRIGRSPRRAWTAIALLRGDPAHLLRNLVVVPKGLWLAGVAEEWGADHIHAHWASTTATMAMIAAQSSELPWRFTAHRWDIADGNLIASKVRHASFARTISATGLQSLF